MGDWQLETAERLASMERSLKYIEEHIKNPPQLASFTKELEKHHTRIVGLEQFKEDTLKKIAWVSGAAAAVSTMIVNALVYVKNFVTIN